MTLYRRQASRPSPRKRNAKKKKKKVYSLKNIQILKNITDRSNKIKGDKGRSDK